MKNLEASESQHQCALIKWASITKVPGFDVIIGDYLLHIPNGGYRNTAEAAKFKRMGVKSGVADLFLALPANGFGGLWIEMKSRKGSISIKQQEFMYRMHMVNYCTFVAFDWEDAKKIIMEYLDEIDVKSDNIKLESIENFIDEKYREDSKNGTR